ncbi:MAG: glycoside hydrolase family 15 protein [Candidatus Eremiobacteraeota bacterium]|nr:glycoside hydrolase family 15 protein [Candidatus Eremiobacteraeota bacterium]
MPRDLPLGNGNLLVNYDANYTIRDIFFPHVGTENHVLGHRCRLGFWADGNFAWTYDDGWERDLRYEPDTLVTAVRLVNAKLGIAVRIADAVDFAAPVLVRRFTVEPTAVKSVRIFLGLDLYIRGNPIGDTAFYKPDLQAVVHYKDDRYFLHGGAGESGGVDQFATGQKAINNQEGTWRDAEDGLLSANSISQGSVDSIIGFTLNGDPKNERILHAWLACGEHIDDVTRLHERVRDDPDQFIKRTHDYWYLWANKEETDFGSMSAQLVNQYKRSLLTIRTQIDDAGGILAANDSDIQTFAGDTYSYVWPRDGSLVAYALDEAGRNELSNRFFEFAGSVVNRDGYFLHKYNPDGTLASSWHPYFVNGRPRLPIQEDETALVLFSLWHHFDRTRSIESIKGLYAKVITPCGDFLVNYTDGDGLCKSSYDLWEERWGIHAFTVGAVYGGLQAAANFANAFGERRDGERYMAAAVRLKKVVCERFFDPAQARFARMLLVDRDGNMTPDWTPDAAITGLLFFGMIDPDDATYVPAFESMFEQLWVKTDVGGSARYVDDTYFRQTPDIEKVPGNPWFICTLWRARYGIARAKTIGDLQSALPLLQWAADHALPSGVLAEQVHPFTDAPLSVSPLTWSHAEYVTTFLAYLDKLSSLTLCPTCRRPTYMREHRRLYEEHLEGTHFDSAG